MLNTFAITFNKKLASYSRLTSITKIVNKTQVLNSRPYSHMLYMLNPYTVTRALHTVKSFKNSSKIRSEMRITYVSFEFYRITLITGNSDKPKTFRSALKTQQTNSFEFP
jgi:hypothetical protein